ncbi:MAG: PIN domain-containing protein, partial [Burkholderiales bacterium]|nr:PIN domain-containing protein [Burkholderiales bacterium]
IDHLNGIERATQFISRNAGRLAVSVVTRAEVLAGIKPRSLSRVRRLLDAFQNLDVTADIADRAAALRRRHRWKLPDAFQAALARKHRLRLATRDTRDFKPGVHRFVLVPYTL